MLPASLAVPVEHCGAIFVDALLVPSVGNQEFILLLLFLELLVSLEVDVMLVSRMLYHNVPSWRDIVARFINADEEVERVVRGIMLCPLAEKRRVATIAFVSGALRDGCTAFGRC
jgi:hypothetical protein